MLKELWHIKILSHIYLTDRPSVYIALKRVDFFRKYKSRKKILHAAESQRHELVDDRFQHEFGEMIAGRSQGELKFMMKHRSLINSGYDIIQWDSRQLQDILQVSFWQRNNDNVFYKASRRRRMRQIYKRKPAALSSWSIIHVQTADVFICRHRKSVGTSRNPCLWALNLHFLFKRWNKLMLYDKSNAVPSVRRKQTLNVKTAKLKREMWRRSCV